jgi:hypothetical protein
MIVDKTAKLSKEHSMNMQRHVIKRQLVELPLASSTELQTREQLFKQLYYQNILPAIEGCFDNYTKPDSYYQVDKIELKVADFDWENLAVSNIIAQLVQQLETQLGKQLSRQTKSTQTEVALPAPANQTSIQILSHFLQTGTLPWWAENLNRQQFDSWLQTVLQQESAILPMLRQALAEPRSRKRCILQFSDKSLWQICQKLLPSIRFVHMDSVPFSKNGVSYPVIASLLGLNTTSFRIQHWDTLLGMSMTSEQNLRTLTFIQKYWDKLAKINDCKLKDWRTNLAKANVLTTEQRKALNDKVIQPKDSDKEFTTWLAELAKLAQLAVGSNDLAAKLAQLEKIKPQGLSTQQWLALKQEFNMLQRMLHDYQQAEKNQQNATRIVAQLKSETLDIVQECQLYLLNFESSVEQLELQLNFIQQYKERLYQIYKLSPPSRAFHEALQTLSHDLNTLFKPYLEGAVVQRCLSLIKYAKVRLLNPNSDQELLSCTQKFYSLIDDELVKLQSIVNYARQNLMEVQQQLSPYQHFHKVLQTLLTSITSPQAALADELVTELKQTTRALIATDLRLQGQHLLEKVGQFQASYAKTTTIASDISKALRKLVKQATETKNKATDTFSDIEEVFISNAGIILLWPYLERFFTRVDLLAEKRFKNQEAAERAAVLCHYLASLHELPSEPLLTLNKLLCGLDLAEPIALEIILTDDEKLAIEELLSAAASNWPALKTTNPQALRQLFLQRNGSIQIKDGSYLVRIERKSHDILLDKLPWSIANIKLPWLDTLIRVEW